MIKESKVPINDDIAYVIGVYDRKDIYRKFNYSVIVRKTAKGKTLSGAFLHGMFETRAQAEGSSEFIEKIINNNKHALLETPDSWDHNENIIQFLYKHRN